MAGQPTLAVHISLTLRPKSVYSNLAEELLISHYAGLRLTREGIELRYVLDMAEIPTFLERQETGLVPEVGHPSLRGYVDRQTVVLQDGLRVEVNGQRLPL